MPSRIESRSERHRQRLPPAQVLRQRPQPLQHQRQLRHQRLHDTNCNCNTNSNCHCQQPQQLQPQQQRHSQLQLQQRRLRLLLQLPLLLLPQLLPQQQQQPQQLLLPRRHLGRHPRLGLSRHQGLVRLRRPDRKAVDRSVISCFGTRERASRVPNRGVSRVCTLLCKPRQ